MNWNLLKKSYICCKLKRFSLMKTKKSIIDISRELKLSKTTVSLVLNGKGNKYKISQHTQKRIIELAKRWNFKPNQLARSLSLGRTRAIGLIVPDISNVFYANVCRKIEDYISKFNYIVTIGSSDENYKKEQELIETMRSRQLDGIILASCKVQSESVLQMLKENYPLILFDRYKKEIQANYILVENEKATARLVEELVKLGHKSIALITITPHASSIQERLIGYKNGLIESNLTYDPNLILEVDFNNRKDGMKEALGRLFYNAPNLSAILFSNNVLAAQGVWAVNMFHQEKVDQLYMASFDNIDLFDYSKPKVISMAQPIDLIAGKSVEQLLKQIKNPKMESETIKLEPNLIFR